MRPYLSSPGKIGALTVKNRVIMEAMGNALSNLDGSMSAEDIAFYEARAKGGAGLIMSEAVSVSSNSGRANPRNLCIDDDKLIPIEFAVNRFIITGYVICWRFHRFLSLEGSF